VVYIVGATGLSLNEPNPFSPKFLYSIFGDNSIRLSKSRGQNYLIDRNIAERIVSLIGESPAVLEVGTGMGALTLLIPRDRQVYSIEIDAGIHRLLSQYTLSPNIELIHADFLKFQTSTIHEKELFFLSNLPYSISGEAVKRFIEEDVFLRGAVMSQKEFYEKMTASPGGPGYGVMSVISQVFLEITAEFNVPRTCFLPQPSVDSVVISLVKKKIDFAQGEFKNFLASCFLMKRKTIENNFKKAGFPLDILMLSGVPGNIRPEEVAPPKWVEIFKRFSDNNRNEKFPAS